MRERVDDVDILFREVLAAPGAKALRALLERCVPDDSVLAKLLRRAVPVVLLEYLARTAPWNERPLVMGALCQNARTPRTLALALLPTLYWRDLAEIARSVWLAPSLRARAESLLVEKLPDLRLGDRVTLARLATAFVLRPLLGDLDRKVVVAALQNPQLREAELSAALQKTSTTRLLIEEAAVSSRWRENYAVRLALVLQARTPLPIALAQLTSLRVPDLRRVAEADGLVPLLQISAQRLAADDRNRSVRKT
jgi:hypothetical protein